MQDYAVIAVATAVLTQLAQMAAHAYAADEPVTLSPGRLWNRAIGLHGAVAGAVALTPVAIVAAGVPSQSVAVAAAVSGSALLCGAWLMPWLAPRGRAAADSAQVELLRTALVRFGGSWAGMLVYGIGLGFLMTIGRWRGDSSLLTDIPGKAESRLYLFIFAGTIALSMLLFWRLNRGTMHRLPTAARLRRAVNYTGFAPALIGLLIALIQNQTRNITLANRYLVIGVLVWMLLALLWVIVIVAPGTTKKLREEKIHFSEARKRLRQKKRRRSRR